MLEDVKMLQSKDEGGDTRNGRMSKKNQQTVVATFT
jgi:hypothetical protein